MLSIAASGAAAGPDWTEVGDAGSNFASAQIPLGNGMIRTIAGSLGAEGGVVDYEDMYIIGIDAPTVFRLELANPNFDAQLFIFNITLAGAAFGLLANDDSAPGDPNPILTPIATDGTMAILDLPGDYLIGVSGKGRNPISAGGLIFNFADPTEISGADGPGGLLRHIGWDGEGEVGDYVIEMDGTVFPEIPAPGALAPLAGVLIARRRRA
jgi:hypothetical protein